MKAQRYVNVPFTLEEYRVIHQAMRRFRLRSMAEFCHKAAFHFAGHNRSTVRPVRAWQQIEKGEAADPAIAPSLSLGGELPTEGVSNYPGLVSPTECHKATQHE